MATPEEIQAAFEVNADIIHQVVRGGPGVSVTTPAGNTLRSMSKIEADNQAALDAVIANFGSAKQDIANKDVSGGYVGLTGNKVNILNADGSKVSTLTSIALAVRQYILPDRDITFAGMDDINGKAAKDGTDAIGIWPIGITGKAATAGNADTVTAITVDQVTAALGGAALTASMLGAANGVVPLDGATLIPAIYLPSYVDDIVETDTKALLPATGDKGKIYLVDADESDGGNTNQYRWSGSAYVKLVSSPGTTDVVTEGATNKYFTAARAIASALDGFSDVTSAPVTAADSIVVAAGKFQGQINTLNTKVASTDTIDEGATNKYFTVARVLGVVLTGLSTATSTAVTAADNFLEALGKLQAQNTAQTAAKDASGGYAGLTLFKLNLRNAANTVTSFVTNTATAVRTWTMPDKDGIVAMLDDITGTNSGVNTGDETQAGLFSKIGFTPINPNLIGAASGIAPLDANSKIAAIYLPSYVDDVLEYADFASLPGTGESGKIYIALDNNAQYRWSGTVYVGLVASPGTTDAVPEGATNKYFTNARVLSTVLAGFSTATATAATAADTVLSALGKLEARITTLMVNNTGTNTGDQTLAGLAAQGTAQKDASGGYAGLTLLKLNLKNVAGTVTSFLTNTATAARTWTMPDKDGTVAMMSDIPAIPSSYTTTVAFAGSAAAPAVRLTNATEAVNIVAAAPTATSTLYASTAAAHWFTIAATANWIINLAWSAGTTMNAALGIGDALTMVMSTVQGGTAFYPTAVQVDGVAVTVQWVGGAPTAGNVSARDVYTITIIKTAASTYSAIAAQTSYK